MKKRGNGKLIRIRGKVNTMMTSGLSLTLEFDRADILEGNVLLVNGKRYWIAHREPEAPAPGQTPKLELREDKSTRDQRRKSIHARRQSQ